MSDAGAGLVIYREPEPRWFYRLPWIGRRLYDRKCKIIAYFEITDEGQRKTHAAPRSPDGD